MASPDIPAGKPTSSAPTILMRACSAISSARPSISAAKPRKWTKTSISSPVRRRQTALVLTVGKFAIVDMFDTNKYANNPKTDFMNWSLTNAGTFDYAGDAWGYSYGAAAEWYQGRFTFRGGVFDLSASPAGGGDNAQAYGLDPTFHQFQLVGEIEERHELWGQPGKLKITGFLIRGNAGSFQDAINLSQMPGPYFGDPTDALAAVRIYQSRPGVSLNLEQQVTESFGVFARAGWADGNVEPWDFADIDRTASGRRLDHRQAMGQTGRHDRHCGRRQRHFQHARRHISTPEAWASSSVTGNCRTPVPRGSSKPITATPSPPRQKSASIISSSPIPPTPPSAGRSTCSPAASTPHSDIDTPLLPWLKQKASVAGIFHLPRVPPRHADLIEQGA